MQKTIVYLKVVYHETCYNLPYVNNTYIINNTCKVFSVDNTNNNNNSYISK